MATRHLDLGCGSVPRNPYGQEEVHAVDLALPQGLGPGRFKAANLVLEPIPYPDSSFDSVSAFDFLEHVPRVFPTVDGRGTRLPFVELMDEIHRVLRPGGRFYAVTPAYPRLEAFVDPTHVNFITDETARYFCGEAPEARPYGFRGTFALLRNERAIFPEAFRPTQPITAWRRYKHWRRLRAGKLSHLVWEFACVKPAAG